MADYSAVTPDNQLDGTRSWRNAFLLSAEPVFLGLFCFEAVIKIIAMGLIARPYTYLRNPWNVLDFTVVMGGLLADVPGMPNISVLRILRLLRPLRSLVIVPSMRKLIQGLLQSIPALLNVLALLFFLFALFGILALQLFIGSEHTRCRLTEAPLVVTPSCTEPLDSGCYESLHNASATDYHAVYSQAAGMYINSQLATTGIAACRPGVAPDAVDSEGESVWYPPADCFWPVDPDNTRACSLTGPGGGVVVCPAGTWCGSAWDANGLPRFSRMQAMRAADYVVDRNWGFTGFDHFGQALLTIFQSITMEGWTDVMYTQMDATGDAFAVIYFVSLVVLGSFFLLNLTLAVIWDNFSAHQADDLSARMENSKAAELAKHVRAMMHIRRVARAARLREQGVPEEEAHAQATQVAEAAIPPDLLPAAQVLPAHHTVSQELSTLPSRQSMSQEVESDDSASEQEHEEEGAEPRKARTSVESAGTTASAAARVYGDSWLKPGMSPAARRNELMLALAASQRAPWRRSVFRLVRNKWFVTAVILLIVINTVVLAADHYPMAQSTDAVLDTINFICSLLFVVEMILKLVGFGLRDYVREKMNLFDALVVVLSIVEIIIAPPSVIGGDPDAVSGVSALRSARLLRVLKLAASWKSLRSLLDTIIATLKDIANFAVLLVLFMLVFAMVGMQFFANQFCFDPDTGLPVGMPGDLCNAQVNEYPRANFDTLGHAIITVFQVLTGENWNSVMYDGKRALGNWAVVYFMALVVMGNFIVLNLFLAILLGNFEDLDLEGGDPEEVKTLARSLRVLTVMGSNRARMLHWVRSRTSKTLWHRVRRRLVCTRAARVQPERSTAPDSPPSVQRVASPTTQTTSALLVKRGQSHHGVASSTSSKAPRIAALIEGPAMRSKRSEAVNSSASGGSGGVGTTPGEPERHGASNEEPPSPSVAAVAPAGSPSQESSPAGAAAQPLLLGGAAAAAGASPDYDEDNSGKAAMLGKSERAASEPTSPAAAGMGSPLRARTEAKEREKKQRRATAVGDAAMFSAAAQTMREGDDEATVGGGSETTQELANYEHAMAARSLFCFTAWSRARMLGMEIMLSTWFKRLILLCIVLSSLALALSNPLDRTDTAWATTLHVADIVFTAVFTIEMVLKIFVLGFCLHRGAYLRNGWNALDCFVVMVSIFGLMPFTGSGLSGLRALRGMRALRPLRAISRRPGLRVVVNALLQSFGGILNVALVCVLFFLMFGIVFVNYLKGGFYSCNGENFGELPALVQAAVITPQPWADWGNATQTALASYYSPGAAALAAQYPGPGGTAPTGYAVCTSLNLEWLPILRSRFDNVGQAMLTLLDMSTTEGWADVMWAGVDSRGQYAQPVRGASPGMAWGFVAFMLVGSFFIVNLFVGVVIDQFNQMRDANDGDGVLLTQEQREWIRTRKSLLRLKPFLSQPKPKYWLQGVLQSVIRRPAFERFVLAAILVNTALMAAQWLGQPQQYTQFLDGANVAFAVIFASEAVIKIMALEFKVYWNSGWNRFDFVVVLVTVVGMGLQYGLGLKTGAASVVRALRVGRVIRLVRRARSLNMLFKTMILTLPSLVNVGGILFLLFFIYAVLGMQLFAGVAHGEYLSDRANFQSFGSSLVTLFRASTGESWNGIMYDLRQSLPGCVNVEEQPWSVRGQICGVGDVPQGLCTAPNGCGSWLAVPYFVSFTVLITFVFMNLFIAVILEGFGESSSESDAGLSDDHFSTFAQIWTKYDPTGTHFVHGDDMIAIMRELPPPLGFTSESGGKVPTSKQMQTALARMDLVIYKGNRIHFLDLVHALARRAFENTLAMRGKAFEAPPIPKGWNAAKSVKERPAFDAESYIAAKVVAKWINRWRERRAERIAAAAGLDGSADSADGVTAAAAGGDVSHGDGSLTARSARSSGVVDDDLVNQYARRLYKEKLAERGLQLSHSRASSEESPGQAKSPGVPRGPPELGGQQQLGAPQPPPPQQEQQQQQQPDGSAPTDIAAMAAQRVPIDGSSSSGEADAGPGLRPGIAASAGGINPSLAEGSVDRTSPELAAPEDATERLPPIASAESRASRPEHAFSAD